MFKYINLFVNFSILFTQVPYVRVYAILNSVVLLLLSIIYKYEYSVDFVLAKLAKKNKVLQDKCFIFNYG